MALVVTARPTAEAQREYSAPVVAPVAGQRLFARIALCGAVIYGAGLVGTSLARFVVPGSALELALQALAIVALVTVLGVALVAWLVSRDDTTALLAATLAAIIAPLRLVSADV